MKKRDLFAKVAYGLLILILVNVIIYSGLRLLESTAFFEGNVDTTEPPSKTVTKGETDYFPRQDITVLLVSGIDKSGPMASSEAYNNSGNADMLSLVIFDEKNREINVLLLNRDTMTDVPVLGINGREAYSAYQQLALSYSYGSGMEDSCENTVKAVSGLLNGISIDHYITFNMDAIQIVNDAVGGVTVNVTDDFSQCDSSIKLGQNTLLGKQAVHYIRARHDVGSQLNLSRMERHKQYMYGFMESLHRTAEKDSSFGLNTYNEVSPYMVTDCSSTVLNDMLTRYADYPMNEIVTLPGDNKVVHDANNEDHYQYIADQEQLDQIVLDLFYAPKNLD